MQSTFNSPILSVGELLWDLLPFGPRLGGTTANFAILCARLGDYVTLISRLGKDTYGQRAMDQLQKVAEDAAGHFDLSGMQWSDYFPTGTVTVAVDSAGRPEYTIQGPAAWDEIVASQKLLDTARSASAVCFGTLAQREPLSRASIRTMLEATSPDCVRVCDINLRLPFCTEETLRWSLHQATVLKISDEELPAVARLLGIPSPNAPHKPDPERITAWASDAAHALLASAPRCRMVAITLGAHGSLLADRTDSHRHPGFPVTVIDTIGAGDAFTAGMVFAYLRESSLEQINIVSNLCGSYVASRPGATPLISPSLRSRIAAVLAGAEG